ncbi:LOW QUALITY PROTEIN: syncollin [Phaenicophaeus curvirostris]|uniref:LOW QUALITY PROTEIN: syncollin n=1 Tax=Phaenicophaeus curvirostris TaxID=33595 RepID=UPI0037F0BBBE
MALALLALLALASPGGAQCPQPSELRAADGSKLCALLYADASDYYEQCCGGASLAVPPGADVPHMPSGWAARVSSLVVGTRCELSVWSRGGKAGSTRRFSAGAVPRLQEVRRGLLGDWDDAIRGYYCKCN